MVCTFFGHRDTPYEILPLLEETVERLIREGGVDTFYVGCEGNFDRMAARLLCRLQQTHPITFSVVLSRLPEARDKALHPEWAAYPTIFPQELELTPPRFAIDRRNRWMLEQAHWAITYVRYLTGGAAKFQALALRRGKRVLNLAEADAGAQKTVV